MPEWLIGWTFVYTAGVAVVVLAGLGGMPSRSSYYAAERKRTARFILTAPVWPLWIPIGLTYGIYRLIQIARTGE